MASEQLTVKQIAESRKDGYWGSPGDDYRCIEAAQHVDYLLARLRAAEELCDVLEEAQDNIAGRYGADSVNRVDGKLLERIAAALAAYKAVQDGE